MLTFSLLAVFLVLSCSFIWHFSRGKIELDISNGGKILFDKKENPGEFWLIAIFYLGMILGVGYLLYRSL